MKTKLFTVAIVSCFVVALVFFACGPKGPETVKIGINAPLTGDIPKVGEGTKFAAQMWLEDVNAAGGIEVGGKKYKVELVIEDNESKAESAVKANVKLITEDEVLAIVGPQSSKQAVPAGGKANEMGTPMVSPWSTNPSTTRSAPGAISARGASRAGDERDRIIALFETQAEISSSDVCQALGVSRATAVAFLAKLIAAGGIQKVGRGPRTRYRPETTA